MPFQCEVRAEVYVRTTEWAMQSIIPPRHGLGHAPDVKSTFDLSGQTRWIAYVQVLQPVGHAKIESLPPRHKRAIERILARKLGLE